jgi:tetratricopeptide (TPR) repeat protein
MFSRRGLRLTAAACFLTGVAAIGGAAWLAHSLTGQLWWVDRALDQGRLDEAEAILVPWARTEEPRVITRRARLRLLQHRPDSVVRLLEPRLKSRADPQWLALLGEADLALGRTQEAWGVYRALLEQRPDDIPTLIRYAELTYRHAGLAEALVPYRRLKDLQPERVDWPKAIGQIYMEIDRYELAAAAFQEALRIEPANGDLRFALAEAEFLAGHLAESLANLDLVSRARPDETRFAAARAECLLALGRTDEAIRQLKDILTRQPSHTRALRLRAEVHLRRREFGRALECLERAQAADPQDWRVLYKLAQVYDRLGRRDEARAAEARMRDLQQDSLDRF